METVKRLSEYGEVGNPQRGYRRRLHLTLSGATIVGLATHSDPDRIIIMVWIRRYFFSFRINRQMWLGAGKWSW